jgi:predicted metalloprotease with PDZ domain
VNHSHVSRNILSGIFFLCISFGIVSAEGIRAIVDFKNINNDRVHVTLYTPKFTTDEILYVMPASIPGTYAKMDFGYFVKNFKATDGTGGYIPVRRLNDNEFLIIGGNRLAKIEYDVNDSYDDTTHTLDVFNPGGTNIQQDTNIMFGAHGFLGYFSGNQQLPYTLECIKPATFYTATSLDKKQVNDTLDILKAKNYDALVDNPAMLSKPDTVSYMQGATKINIAVYSTGGKVTAEMVAKVIKPVTKTVESFLGTMPVDRYTFLFYFVGENRKDLRRKEAYGALEHNYSSMYFLPETSDQGMLKSWIAQTAVHEFLHILVPLNLHSKEIASFDFREPKMSRHLWLYEGVTEYFSVLSRAQSGDLNEKEFRRTIRQKIFGSMFMMPKPVAMTELSKNVLLPEYQKMYGVVYEKGALLGMFLDITLREQSGGKITLLSLIRELTKKFGPDRPFEDTVLFNEIEAVAGKDIRPFLNTYFDSATEIPYTDMFAKIGWKYVQEDSIQGFAFSGVRARMNDTALQLNVRKEDNILGAKQGDIVLSVNGITVNPTDEEVNDSIISMINDPETEDEVSISVKREGDIITLKGSPKSTKKQEKSVILENPEANDAQKALFKHLLTH